MREDNSTPFIMSEKAHGIAGMQTGLVKDSSKAQDLNAQIDFGTQENNPETSIMDNSMNDTTQLV